MGRKQFAQFIIIIISIISFQFCQSVDASEQEIGRSQIQCSEVKTFKPVVEDDVIRAGEQIFQKPYSIFNQKTCYNSNQDLLTEISFRSLDSLHKTVKYEYNASKKISTKKFFNIENKLIKEIQYLYDQNNREIERRVMNNGELSSKRKFEYRDSLKQCYEFDFDSESYFLEEELTIVNNEILNRTSYHKSGNSYLYLEIVYNSNGDIIEKRTFDNVGGKLKGKTQLLYSENNELISTLRTDLVAKESVKSEYQYGELTSRSHKREKSNSIHRTHYEIEFDDRDNWIRQVCYKDGIPEYVRERTLTYFE